MTVIDLYPTWFDESSSLWGNAKITIHKQLNRNNSEAEILSLNLWFCSHPSLLSACDFLWLMEVDVRLTEQVEEKRPHKKHCSWKCHRREVKILTGSFHEISHATMEEIALFFSRSDFMRKSIKAPLKQTHHPVEVELYWVGLLYVHITKGWL